MMRFLTVVLAAALVAFPATAHAASVMPAVPMTPGTITPAEAVEIGLARDGARVVVQGEALGEALVAPGGKRWVNLLGGGVAIGAVVEAKDADAVTRFGEYRQQGATLVIEGIVNSACDDHGGDLDLHATSVRLVDEGRTMPHAIHPNKLLLAAAAASAATILALQYRRLRRRSFM